ncbi:hypothetical protein DFW101_3537 [Solidesulfovibrio carbinoliphilus subsp. oakridgensis]|uniref:Helix-turn-helix domain-containing protein n=1 Tax=Solidesulfovibrio carbinoliphilus subsp. oakridgensis TaxID=694327 RepID=G7QC87_9BACT|nr:helix-turn-helix domain-containing protein [Solidesulfovibrio carbinoliphilus]EHJ49533.1 hypothetical protein DFW101_3537 [Solidesulfovibrio carbinoliphilus subsp. oakridgensis]
MTRAQAFGKIYAIIEKITAGRVKNAEAFFPAPAIFLGTYARQYMEAGEPGLDLWGEAMEALEASDLTKPLLLAEQGDFWIGYYAAKHALRLPGKSLSTKETAKILGIDAATVRQQLAAGRFPGATKFGRDWQIPSGAVAEYRTKSARQGTVDDVDRDVPAE